MKISIKIEENVGYIFQWLFFPKFIRLSSQYQKAICEVSETHQFYMAMLEERKAEIHKELEQAYSSKQVS